MVSRDQTFDPVSRASRPAPEKSEAEAPVPEVERLTFELRNDVQKILRSLKRIWFIEWKRLSLRVIDVGFQGALYLCALGLALTLAIGAALLLVSGIRAALFAWTEIGWAADLGAGILVLGSMVAVGLAVRARVRRNLLASTKRALAAMADPPPFDAGPR